MTYAKTSEYKGHPTFSVYADEQTAKEHPEKPIVSIGVRKLKALFDHSKELAVFFKANIGKLTEAKPTTATADKSEAPTKVPSLLSLL